MTESPPGPWSGYQEGLARGELRFQRCGECGRAVFYPRLLCPFCGSADPAWETAAGGGTVYATTTMRPRDEAPYHVCLVDLDEGFRMMSRVDGVAPDAVRIGDRLRLLIVEEDGRPVPTFVPAERS
ncbi:MAG: OB-fold domain-containing protein [Actinobacteria bacterium]|nr:OB-fold domain-containing protein [Actinomycetota bacterium]